MFGLSRWVWLIVFVFAGLAATSGFLLRTYTGVGLLPTPVTLAESRPPTAEPAGLNATGKPAAPMVEHPATPIAAATTVPSAASDAVAVDPQADALDGAQARADGLDVPSQNDQTAVSSAAAAVPAGDVPVLMYHYIRVNPVATDQAGFNLSVTPTDFAAQMRYLAENGYHPVTMAQIREHVIHGTGLPSRPIALTFDDGYDDMYTAARPILEQYHFTATFFIITGFVGRPGYVTWSQVRALDTSGFEIGSHTVHHAGLPFVKPTVRQAELTESRATLESYLGHAVLDFCYPSGEVDAPTELAVREAGYLSATTTAPGWAGTANDPLRIPRVRVSGGVTLAQFVTLLGRAPRPVVASLPLRRTPTATAKVGQRAVPTATAKTALPPTPTATTIQGKRLAPTATARASR